MRVYFLYAHARAFERTKAGFIELKVEGNWGSKHKGERREKTKKVRNIHNSMRKIKGSKSRDRKKRKKKETIK